MRKCSERNKQKRRVARFVRADHYFWDSGHRAAGVAVSKLRELERRWLELMELTESAEKQEHAALLELTRNSGRCERCRGKLVDTVQTAIDAEIAEESEHES